MSHSSAINKLILCIWLALAASNDLSGAISTPGARVPPTINSSPPPSSSSQSSSSQSSASSSSVAQQQPAIAAAATSQQAQISPNGLPVFAASPSSSASLPTSSPSLTPGAAAAAASLAASLAAATAPTLSVQASPMLMGQPGGLSVAGVLAQNLLSPSSSSLVSGRVDSSAEQLLGAKPNGNPASISLQQKQQQQQLHSIQQDSYSNIESECAASNGFISFELMTDYVLSAPADSMLVQPGTLQLTDCLNMCRMNSSCLAINFETGLCVLLQESADKNPQALQRSSFPVFTIYAHKICLQGDRMNRCHKSWSFERVTGWVLNNLEKKTLLTKTRLECLQACYSEQSFQCKSFNYDSASGSCQLSDMDRHSLPSAVQRRRHYVESTIDTIDYGENNCIQEVRGICDFKPLQNRILKTVDSIYQDIKTEPECRKRCLQAPYRCHSYDLGDSSNPVCRTSHLDRNSLQQIQEPYLDIQGAISYELDSCYNVTVVCKSREMVARVKTNKIFNGKIYAKNSPLSCVNDITNSMDFELSMAFNDACSINRTTTNGLFTNEIVLQHNDMIVTNNDMGLNIKCQYDLRNQTVYNNINLDDFMNGREPIDIASQSAVVKSPNISMSILRHDGNHITQAQVGDALLLRFQIADDRSPFEIFVRDLYAMDGVGGSEIMLIDGEGCPTDPSIMAAMTNAKGNGQTLEAQFDAFKFPTSETVAFRALVTPCIPHCEPVHCQNRVFDGTLYEAESFGKRRRRKRSVKMALTKTTSTTSGAPEEVVVRNSIEIKDKFFSDSDSSSSSSSAADQNQLGERTAYELSSASADQSTTNDLFAASNSWWPFSSSTTGGKRSSSSSSSSSGNSNSRHWTEQLRLGGVAFLFCALLVCQSVLFVGWAVILRRRNGYKASLEQQTNSNSHNHNHRHNHHLEQQQNTTYCNKNSNRFLQQVL